MRQTLLTTLAIISAICLNIGIDYLVRIGREMYVIAIIKTLLPIAIGILFGTIIYKMDKK